LSVQVDVREWSQDFDGAEQLTATRALLAVPPIVTIPAGEHQIVRIGQLGAPAENVEKTFRVLVTELAGAPAATGSPGLNMRLRLSIPVFVAPVARPAAADIAIEDIASTEDGMRVTLHNTGNAHAKIERIDVRSDGEWSALPVETVSAIRYLLPDARAQLALAEQHVTAIRIRAEDGGEWEHAVPALR
jgi:fimbrial chaperone protein